MAGNVKPLEAATIAGRKGIFCVVNRINYFSENVEPCKCGCRTGWCKPFE